MTDTRTPDQIAEEGIGLIAQAAFRARKWGGKDAEITLLADVSAFTTKLHVEALRARNHT